MADDLVTVATFRFANEAELAKMHLQEEGLTAYLADAETVNMDWFLGNALGYIKLQVPQSQAETATALLAKHPPEKPFADGHDEEMYDAQVCLACGKPMAEEDVKCRACGWSYEGEEE